MASGYMFSHYWPGDGSLGSTPVVGGKQPYQYGAVMSFLGTGYEIPRRWRKKLTNLGMKMWRLLPRRLQVWFSVTKLIFGVDFNAARAAVDQISTDPFSRDMRKWNAIMAERIQSDPNMHENVSRFLAASDLMTSTLSRPSRNLLIELAWTGRKNG